MENKLLLERVEKLEKENIDLMQEQDELLERVSTLECVARSLVAMSLENPEAIDWTELSQFFIETDKG